MIVSLGGEGAQLRRATHTRTHARTHAHTPECIGEACTCAVSEKLGFFSHRKINRDWTSDTDSQASHWLREDGVRHSKHLREIKRL